MERARIEQQFGAWLAATLALAEAGDLPMAATIAPDAASMLGAATAFGGEGAASGGKAPSMEGLELGRVLGAGGMGVVRAARQPVLGREVAVKMLHGGGDAEVATESLLREARVMGLLEHPNVVPVYAVGADATGRPQVVMRKIGGTTWAELLADADEVRRRFGAEDLLEWNLRILLQVMNAIRFAHSRHVLHRDLKPTNVMIGEFGEVYLLDWGLAVTLDDDEERIPRASAVRTLAGTPCYMAPEMLQPEVTSLSMRTDVYLLGAVLFEVLAGQPPHRGDSAAEIARQVERSEPEMPASAPPEIAALCQRALARDPAERWATVADMERGLQAFLEHRGSTEICGRALAMVEGLEDDLAGATGQTGERQRLYQLFAPVRFGFREALAAWASNEVAAAGLDRAIAGMVRYELEHGEVHAAEPLLAELATPSPELTAAVEEALAREDEALATVDRLRKRADRRFGSAERRLLALAVGIFWTLVPALVAATVGAFSYPMHFAAQGVFLAGWLGFGAVGRRWVASTLLNRQIYQLIIAAITAALVLETGYFLAGHSAVQTQVGHLFIFFVAAIVGAVVIERRLWPSSLSYGLAYLLGSARPELSLGAMVVANLLLTVNVTVIWRDPPDDEDEDEAADLSP